MAPRLAYDLSFPWSNQAGVKTESRELNSTRGSMVMVWLGGAGSVSRGAPLRQSLEYAFL